MDQHQLNALSGIVLILMPIVILVFMAILVLPYWFIWKKAGFSPWLSLLMFIPMVNLVMLYVPGVFAMEGRSGSATAACVLSAAADASHSGLIGVHRFSADACPSLML